MDLHGLRRVLRPLYLFLVNHDLLNKQPQQFRRQLRDIRIPLRFVEEAVRPVHGFTQTLDLTLFLWDAGGDTVLFFRVAAGEHLKLLCCDAAQHTVLIQLFEDRVQFRFPFPHGCQFLLLPADLPLKLGGLLAANVGGELFRMFPRRARHPAQVLQYDLVQNTLPDIMPRASFPVLLVGATGKVIVAGGHGMCPVQHHVGAAVGTEHKTGVLALFFHLGQTALVLPHSLYHVPDLPRNEGGMGILKDHAFLSWMLDPPFVLVGLRTVLHVDGVAQINFVFQQVGNGTV